MCPQRQNSLVPDESGVPVAANAAPPSRRIKGTLARVSTLLTAVGWRKSPAWVGKRGLFAANVGSGAAAEFDLEIEPLTEDVLAQQPVLCRDVERMCNPLRGQRVLAAQIEVAGLRPSRQRGNGHAFDNRKRIAFHQDAVFKRARLGFIGVANDIVPAIRVLFQKLALEMERLPFFCRGKGRAAATEEARSSYFADYTLWAQLN